MSEDNFFVDNKEGRIGELYVQKHLNELITSVSFGITDTSTEKIEGKDFIASIADQKTGEITEANIEVKTVRGFMFRTNDNEEESGTIGFELWKSSKRKSPGWLLQMLKPDGKKSVSPDILIFLLIAYDRPFASVAFENVPALFDRLEKLSAEMGFDLHDIPMDPVFAIPSGLLIDNMWMLPLKELADLAHIVMIGEQPRLRPTITAPDRLCKAETQGTRYDYLHSISKQSVPGDNEFVFKGNKGTQTITIVARNLDLIESINLDQFEQLKYMNRTGTFARLWEGIYLFMLSREYPEREYKGDRYYPISYQTVSRWGYKNGINSQSETWFNYMKHLLEFGLLKHFRPHTKSTNPVDRAVNKNNPHPRSVEYYFPVELTRDLLMEADCKAQTYRLNKRRTSTTSRASMEVQSGLETARRSFQDERTLTKQDRYVWDLAVQLLDKEIERHDYIPVDTFFAKLWTKITNKQKLSKIEKVQSQEDVKEQKRYNKYLSALNLLRKEKKDFISQTQIYRMGPVKKTDIYWLGEIPYGTQIITYKVRPDYYDKKYMEASEENRKKENAKRREKRKAKKQQQE